THVSGLIRLAVLRTEWLLDHQYARGSVSGVQPHPPRRQSPFDAHSLDLHDAPSTIAYGAVDRHQIATLASDRPQRNLKAGNIRPLQVEKVHLRIGSGDEEEAFRGVRRRRADECGCTRCG